jgi:hypothetical protein
LAVGISIAGGQTVHDFQDGVISVEAEDLSYSSMWQKNTSPSGYSGSGWLKYVGPYKGNGTDCHHDDLGGKCQGSQSDWLIVRANIPSAGTYYCEARVYHVKADGDNDAWMNLTSTPNGAGRFGENAHPTFSSAGEKGFYIAGRSNGYGIDRILVYEDGKKGDARRLEGFDGIESPGYGSQLEEGKTYTFTAGTSGEWIYDASNDGKGKVTIGSGASVDLQIPTGVTGPKLLSMMFRASTWVDIKDYLIVASGGEDIVSADRELSYQRSPLRPVFSQESTTAYSLTGRRLCVKGIDPHTWTRAAGTVYVLKDERGLTKQIVPISR